MMEALNAVSGSPACCSLISYMQLIFDVMICFNKSNKQFNRQQNVNYFKSSLVGCHLVVLCCCLQCDALILNI